METRVVKREAVTVMGLMRRFSDEDEHVGELAVLPCSCACR